MSMTMCASFLLFRFCPSLPFSWRSDMTIRMRKFPQVCLRHIGGCLRDSAPRPLLSGQCWNRRVSHDRIGPFRRDAIFTTIHNLPPLFSRATPPGSPAGLNKHFVSANKRSQR
jgi:hypothetical protein